MRDPGEFLHVLAGGERVTSPAYHEACRRLLNQLTEFAGKTDLSNEEANVDGYLVTSQQ